MEDFEGGWKPEMGDYCIKLVEFCSGKAVNEMRHNIEGNINDGSFSRLTYDMMLAWERPSSLEEEHTVIPIPTKIKIGFSFQRYSSLIKGIMLTE